jgi:peptidoglycan/xylan/chitin deacetylase (PgdA/CDA1 family)
LDGDYVLMIRAGKKLLKYAGLSREGVAAKRLLFERHLLTRTRRPPADDRGRILCYHSVGTPEWGVNDVAPSAFRRQIELALRNGYEFVSAESLAKGEGRSKQLAITFDDGLLSVATNAMPILQSLGIPSSVFIVSDWAEQPYREGLFMGWQHVERAAALGAQIGSHSVSHRVMSTLTHDELSFELYESRRMIEQRIGISTSMFAIPMGQSGDWTQEAGQIAENAGYTTVFAQSMNLRPTGTAPRTFITGFDSDAIFSAALCGAFDSWEEWVWSNRK